jgi:hypothetical protein
MKKIISPIQQNEQGTSVANLQDALLVLLQTGGMIPGLANFGKGLSAEREANLYGGFTARVVTAFQVTYKSKYKLTATGNVDKQTAHGLNAQLKAAGIAGI